MNYFFHWFYKLQTTVEFLKSTIVQLGCQTPYLTGKNLYSDEITHFNRYIKIRSQL